MMGLIRLQIFTLIVLSSSLYTILYVNGNSAELEPEADTSLFDWVAFNLLDDYVDLLEMTAWFGRRVKDHIDELVDNSFMLFTKQQDVLDPAIQLADKYNRPDCSEGQIMSVTDAVFKEFFNMNINCPTIGQKMSVFFNELHNITQHVTDIHRRYLHAVPNCAPPVLPRPERACLQNLVDSTKRETGLLRTHMNKLSYDIDEFMDGQVEEAFQCVLKGMSSIRNKTKQAVHEIHFCLDLEDNNYNKKYDSPLVRQVMGNVKRPFDHLEITSSETLKETEANQQPQHRPGMPPPPNAQFHPGQPPPPYPHGIPPPGTHPGHYPGMNPQFYPGMNPQFPHPQHPGFPNPQQPPHFQQPGMPNPQQHPNFQQPGIPNPNFQQPGIPNPQQHPHFQQPGIPHGQIPHDTQTTEKPNSEQADLQQSEPFNPQNPEGQPSEIPDPDTLPAIGEDFDPPWRLSPDKKPKYARSDYHDGFVLPKFEEGELPQFETGKNNKKNDGDNKGNHEDEPHHEDIKKTSIHNEF